MSTPHEIHPATDHLDEPLDKPVPTRHHKGSGHGHGPMMWLMCLPMVIFAVVLMTTTSAGAAALIPAILCIAMMAMMMGMLGKHDGH